MQQQVKDTLNYIRFDYTVEEIRQITDEYIKFVNETINEICKLELNECTYENVVWYYSNKISGEQTKIQPIVFLQHVSTNEEIRNISREIGMETSRLLTDIIMNMEFYKRVNYVHERMNKLDTLKQRHVNIFLNRFGDGIKMSSKKKETLKDLTNRIHELESEFGTNIAEDNSYILCTKKELEGCDKIINETETTKNGRYKIYSKNSLHIGLIINRCVNEETRRRVYEMRKTRCSENIGILEELHEHRQRVSELNKYKNNAEYKMSDQILHQVEDVDKLLKTLKKEITTTNDKYYNELKELKCEEQGNAQGNKIPTIEREGLSSRTMMTRNKKRKMMEDDNIVINGWDEPYYRRKYIEHMSSEVKMNGGIASYFPTEYTLNEMLRFYGELFSLLFIDVKNQYGYKYPTWHKDVIVYAVHDGNSDTNYQLMGYIYCDLYPREGKYDHYAMFDMIGGYEDENKIQQVPVVALVGNFARSENGDQPVLSHEGLSTLFHEFGHTIHGICGGYKNKYYEFSGTNVETDFVEIPSQMKEHWIFDRNVIKRISKHIKTGEQISDELIDVILKTRYIGKCHEWMRIISMSMIDQTIQKRRKMNSEEMKQVTNDITKEYMPGNIVESLNAWGHLGGGYDARYYSYVWTMVVACDLYSKFAGKSMEEQKIIGEEYRKKIMEPGGTKSGMSMIMDFLGRSPSIKPFLEDFIGIDMSEKKVSKLNFISLQKYND